MGSSLASVGSASYSASVIPILISPLASSTIHPLECWPSPGPAVKAALLWHLENLQWAEAAETACSLQDLARAGVGVAALAPSLWVAD